MAVGQPAGGEAAARDNFPTFELTRIAGACVEGYGLPEDPAHASRSMVPVTLDTDAEEPASHGIVGELLMQMLCLVWLALKQPPALRLKPGVLV